LVLPSTGRALRIGDALAMLAVLALAAGLTQRSLNREARRVAAHG